MDNERTSIRMPPQRTVREVEEGSGASSSIEVIPASPVNSQTTHLKGRSLSMTSLQDIKSNVADTNSPLRHTENTGMTSRETVKLPPAPSNLPPRTDPGPDPDKEFGFETTLSHEFVELAFSEDNEGWQLHQDELEKIEMIRQPIVLCTIAGQTKCDEQPGRSTLRYHQFQKSPPVILLEPPANDSRQHQDVWESFLSFSNILIILSPQESQSDMLDTLLSSHVETQPAVHIVHSGEIEEKTLQILKKTDRKIMGKSARNSKYGPDHVRPVYHNIRQQILEPSKETEKVTLPQRILDQKLAEICRNCRDFSIPSVAINGRRLVQLLNICLGQPNGKKTIDYHETFLQTIQKDLGLLADTLGSRYASLLTEVIDTMTLPVHENILTREHERLHRQIMSELENKMLPDDELFQQMKQGLEDNIKGHYHGILEENRTLSEEKCQGLIRTCFGQIRSKLDSGVYSIKSPEYQTELKEAIDKYKATPGMGPRANQVLVDFMKTLGKRSPSVMSESVESLSTFTPQETSDKAYSFIAETISTHVSTLTKRITELEIQNTKLSEELKTLTIATKQSDQTPRSESGLTSERPSTSPVTSLDSEDTQWIHVDKQQAAPSVKNKQPNGHKEVSENEVKLQAKVKKLKDQVKELADANKSWEAHCVTEKERFSDQMSMLMQELNDTKTYARKLEKSGTSHEQKVAQIKSEMEQKITEAEELQTKATAFASAQAEKVDELKKTLKKLKQQNQKLEEQVQALRRELALHGARPELLQLNVENTPPQSFGATQQSQASVEGSLWESIPPSLLLEQPMTNECCRQLQQKLAQAVEESKALKQQMNVYKEDFLKERRDRENAHAEISSMQTACVQLTEANSALEASMTQKTLEIEALKASRQQDQDNARMKQAQIERLERNLRTAKDQVTDLQEETARLKRQPLPRQPPPPYDAVPVPRHRESTLNDVLMPDEWKREIQRNYTSFVNYMKTFEVVNIMYSKDLISYNTKSRIDAMQIESDRTRYLFSNVIMRMTRQEILAFKQILFNTNQATLARLLPSEQRTGQDWHCPRCTYKNPGTRDRCEMCTTRAPNLEPLAGAVEQCDEGEAEWVEPAGLTHNKASTERPFSTSTASDSSLESVASS